MIVDLILARREIEALKLELAHSHATCDELREKLTKAKEAIAELEQLVAIDKAAE